MGQTRMFRDRVVSMEQTLEGGEKHLPLLKELCREAFPDFEYAEHALDHERDLFLMELRGPDGAAKKIAWTRMVLYDAERIPTLTGDPAAELRGKIVEFLKARAARPEIVVTFRHLEEGWVDTPEPRREGGGRRRRRGGRGGGRGGARRRRRPTGGRERLAAASAGRRSSAVRRGRGPRTPGPRPRPTAPRPAPPADRRAQAQARPGPAVAGPAAPARAERPGKGRKAPPPVPPATPRRRGPGGGGNPAPPVRRPARERRGMNFAPTEDQERIRGAVREFAEREIAPGVSEREKTGTFPSEALAGLAAMGVLGMMVPEAYGGAGSDALSYVLAIEELARVCASTAVIVSVNNSVACYPIWKFGSESQKSTILRELASGEALARTPSPSRSPVRTPPTRRRAPCGTAAATS